MNKIGQIFLVGITIISVFVVLFSIGKDWLVFFFALGVSIFSIKGIGILEKKRRDAMSPRELDAQRREDKKANAEFIDMLSKRNDGFDD